MIVQAEPNTMLPELEFEREHRVKMITRLSSPTTQQPPGRELVAARCEKPIPLQRARHPDTAAASLTSARRSNGLLARLTPAATAAADAVSPWGVVCVSTAAMTSSVSVDERALILAMAP